MHAVNDQKSFPHALAFTKGMLSFRLHWAECGHTIEGTRIPKQPEYMRLSLSRTLTFETDPHVHGVGAICTLCIMEWSGSRIPFTWCRTSSGSYPLPRSSTA